MLIKSTRPRKNQLRLTIPLCISLLAGYALPTLSIADEETIEATEETTTEETTEATEETTTEETTEETEETTEETEETAEETTEEPEKNKGNSGNNGNGNSNSNKKNQTEAPENEQSENQNAKNNGAGGRPICSNTAQNLFKSCRHTAIANKWLGASLCLSVNDPLERLACNKSYMAVWAETKKDCKSERVYRRDTCDALGESRYVGWAEVDFLVDADTPITGNTYFPLVAETRMLVSDSTTISREVTDTIRVVDGKDCKLVIEEERDTDTDVLIERRELLYAQDISDNVWACGALYQDYEVLDEGQPAVVVGTEGSWQSGSDGALAGLVMPAGEPAYGTVLRRSYAPGVQEVTAEVIDPASIETSIACETDCTILRAGSPAQPEGYYDEYYNGGTGFVFGENQDGEAVIQEAP
jgi:hypothetical protein